MSSTEVMTEHDTQSPAAATVDAKLGCHPERSEGSACRLKAAPASRVPARRYAPRDDNRSLSGLVRVQAIPSLLQHGAFDAHREDRRRHPLRSAGPLKPLTRR